MNKTYSEMLKFSTFKERFNYLKLNGLVGENTFGLYRFVNQNFYKSTKWRRVRNEIIIRDDGCDLAISDRPIFDQVYIHHINPLGLEDIEYERAICYDPENLICVSHNTHNAIHYGDDNLLIPDYVERFPNDTIPWKR